MVHRDASCRANHATLYLCAKFDRRLNCRFSYLYITLDCRRCAGLRSARNCARLFTQTRNSFRPSDRIDPPDSTRYEILWLEVRNCKEKFWPTKESFSIHKISFCEPVVRIVQIDRGCRLGLKVHFVQPDTFVAPFYPAITDSLIDTPLSLPRFRSSLIQSNSAYTTDKSRLVLKF